MNEYQEKLKSLGFVSVPTTSKKVTKHFEDTNRVVGYEIESGKPGTGVSEKQDAKITGGEAYLNPAIVKACTDD